MYVKHGLGQGGSTGAISPYGFATTAVVDSSPKVTYSGSFFQPKPAAPVLTPEQTQAQRVASYSAPRMKAYTEQQLREAVFAAQGADIAFYEDIRKYVPSEAQQQEMTERRGEANANQITETDDGLDVATYANGQAVAPPGGVGAPRPGDGAPGGAAALIPLGLLALLFLA